MLQNYIIQKRLYKDILLMTHVVIGYPGIVECYKLVSEMQRAGVDLIELQIPDDNAHLDGDLIRDANTRALINGVTIEQSFAFAAKLTANFNIPFVFVVYYRTIIKFGCKEFFREAKSCNVQAIIIPDIPDCELDRLYQLAYSSGTSIVPVIFPGSSYSKFNSLLEYPMFCYCATHAGSTGEKASFDQPLLDYISSVKTSVTKPVAVGFGVRKKCHIEYLKNYADIAVVGSEVLKVLNKDGIDGVVKYLLELSEALKFSSELVN